MSNLKLAVEVVRAHNLIPKDGKGSSNAFVELSFEGQKFRTTVKEKDLDPFWKETFFFNLLKPNDLQNLTLEAHVYSSNKVANSKSSLGKVKITGASFVPYSDASLCNYPLEKGGMFSKSRGELGLKVYMTDDTYVQKSSASVTEKASSSHSSVYSSLHELPPEKVEQVATGRPSSIKKATRHAFFSIPDSNSQRQELPRTSTASQPTFGVNAMRPEPQGPRVIQMKPGQPTDFTIRETSPVLGGGQVVGGHVKRSDKRPHVYDLVEPMEFLFVRVVKARDLPMMDLTGSLDPYVEVKLGNYKGVTRHFDKTKNPEWNTVFTFSKDRLQASVIEIAVKDKDTLKDDLVGTIRYDLRDVPKRVPPDSPLAPEWFRLVDEKGEKDVGELMIAVWMGTQADEAFPDAWHSDFASVIDSSVPTSHTRSKVYPSPRLWYVRVMVIEAQDMILTDKSRFPNLHVKVQIGSQTSKSKIVPSQTMNAMWNEEMIFVAAEPFDEPLVISVEDRVGPNKDEVLGQTYIPLTAVERRFDDKMIHSKWFNLQRPSIHGIEEPRKDKYASRIHIRACLDGGYHVLDEPAHYSSDLRPAAKQLWKSAVGILELGILNADAIAPMKTRDGRGTTDSFCVAKYGQKWVRTRTIINNLNPKYNEQYTWEVHDPATVITIGVFDNGQIGEKGISGNKDSKIGKVRIRISTLKTGHVYTHSYPLLILTPSGVKKMGELHLAIRFSCTSMVNIIRLYAKPPLPKMHYARPMSVNQIENLRHHAVNIVAAKLIRSEPPLKKEVTEYMSDADSQLWSMRRSKANFYRLRAVFDGPYSVWKWLEEVCSWKNPVTTVLVHILFVMLMCYPELIIPTAFLYMFLIGLWNLRFRPKEPPHMDIKLSNADSVHPDELDEEFDVFPTSRGIELVRMRYDRLRSVSGRIQTVVGQIASQGERLQAILSWRDPRSTMIFMVFCVFAAFVFYAVPFQLLVIFYGLWVMRHPKLFRHKIPPAPFNFFRRLPAKTDSLL